VDREERLAQNEVVVREVNERVKAITGTLQQARDEDTWEFVCECVDPTCTQPIALRAEEYEDVRRDPIQFVVAPGHERPDIEDVVRSTARFSVVSKTEAEHVAEDNDPRG
jgi:hypothetical protein